MLSLRHASLLALSALLAWGLLPAPEASADWPQWRGPERNGVAAPGARLPAGLSDENPPVKLWESEAIPSDHDGGHGSVAVAGGKVYVSIVWHRDVPVETRRVDSRVLSNLNYRGTENLGEELVARMEHERENLSRSLRGAALDEWAKAWVEEHLDEKTQLSLGGWVIGRFKQGPNAIPISVFDHLREAGNPEFPGQAEMEAWVMEQGFEESVAKRVIEAVPTTVKEADDVVLCLDADTGETLWKFAEPGHPSGRGSASTPAVTGDRAYAALSNHLYCLDAESGDEIWRAPLVKKGPASSPLAHEGRVYLQHNVLSAFDAATGEELWQNKDASASNPSPVLWNDGERDLILCNGGSAFVGVDAATGETLWSTDGGGDSTPAVSGDIALVVSRADGKNLLAYRLRPGGSGPELIWSQDFTALRYGASPVIHEGRAYHLGSARHLCVDLATGETIWERPASSSISSPAFADGKLLIYENNGGFLAMLDASADDYAPLGRAKIGALYCASPAIVGDRLYLRTPGSVAAFQFP